jgi:hypothetical protein
VAGFYFGKSRWDEIPQALGLTVVEGALTGAWRGVVPVQARFDNAFQRYNANTSEGDYVHYTLLSARLDPPLLLPDPEHFRRVVDQGLRDEVARRAQLLGLSSYGFGDQAVSAQWQHYEENAERYRAAFELLAWAAQTIQARRAADPPRWELEVRHAWPGLAQAWGLSLDPRRGQMEGGLRGRSLVARLAAEQHGMVTEVRVSVALPAGTTMSLVRQEGDGFWKRLFRGQDIQVGDAAFDDAFIIKGEPEPVVRSLLGPLARRKILGLVSTSAAFELKDGTLTTWGPDCSADPARLDALLKASLEAAEAICPHA